MRITTDIAIHTTEVLQYMLDRGIETEEAVKVCAVLLSFIFRNYSAGDRREENVNDFIEWLRLDTGPVYNA